jgi:hypothetical protein
LTGTLVAYRVQGRVESLRFGDLAMAALMSTHRRGRLLVLAALPGLAGLTALSVARQHQVMPPPPFEAHKLGPALFSARDQP